MRNEPMRRVPLNVLVTAGPAFFNIRNVTAQTPFSIFALSLTGGFDRYGQKIARNQRSEVRGQPSSPLRESLGYAGQDGGASRIYGTDRMPLESGYGLNGRISKRGQVGKMIAVK
jgi:hypothetical protein